MTIEVTSPEPDQGGPLTRVLIVAVMGPLGVVLLMAGLGSHDFDWLRPNPRVPHWAFGMLGLIVLGSVALLILQTLRVPRFVINAIGWSVMALSFGVMTWMAFDDGGHLSCFIGFIPLVGSYGQAICSVVFRLLVVVTDIVALLVLGACIAGRGSVSPKA